VAGNQELETLLRLHREEIDAIDAQILCLLNQRAECAKTIGEIKGSGAIYRPEREAQVLRQIQQMNQGPLPDESVVRLFREIMSMCLAMERPLTVAYLGPQGTFSEAAVIKHFGHAAKTLPCSSIDEAFRLVEVGRADYVVAPVENSTEGAVGQTLDLMVSTSLQVCGEVIVRVQQTLLRKVEGLEGIRCVYSHAQSLAQCHTWLNKNLPGVPRLAVSSNAEAARLAMQDSSVAAIASQLAGKYFKLLPLVQNIEDEPNNTTRFYVLGHESVGPSGQDKTSLILSTKNKPGAMHSLIEPLARHGISMTRLESRPSRTGLWEYVFFVDLDGHQQNPHICAALTELKNQTIFVKVLGSYPWAVL
jgi:chorismate mutase/prephenate dehydratase